jgi:hypothetical protein
VAVLVLAAATPLGERLGALADLSLVTVILAGLIAYEAVRYRELRHRIRRAHAQ